MFFALAVFFSLDDHVIACDRSRSRVSVVDAVDPASAIAEARKLKKSLVVQLCVIRQDDG